MPRHECMDVRIQVDGRPLVEYPDPDDANNSHHDLSRYVEVKTGQTFSVKVKILPGFQLLDAPYLCVEFEVDHDTASQTHHIRCEDEADIYRGILQNTLTEKFDGTRFRDPVTGTWYLHNLEFGALGISETAYCPPTFSMSDLEKLGSIKVSIFLGKRRERYRPYVWDGEKPPSLDELPEKILEGKGLKNNVKFGAKTPTAPPSLSYYDYMPINGVFGQAYNFTFKYRNRKTLQYLGCIPRSPSPPPDLALMLERTEDMLRVSKQQASEQSRNHNLRILALEEQLAQTRGPVTKLAGDGARSLTGRESSVKLEYGHLPASDARKGKLTSNIKSEGEGHASQSLGKRPRSATGTAEEDDDLVEMAPLPKKTNHLCGSHR